MLSKPEILPGKRIGDAERNRYADHLGDMMSQGFITQEEHDRRVSATIAARTELELAGLVTDLPPLPLSRESEAELKKQERQRRRAEHTSWARFRLGVLGCITLAATAVVLAIPVNILIDARPAHAPMGAGRAAALSVATITAIALLVCMVVWWSWLVSAFEQKKKRGHGRP